MVWSCLNIPRSGLYGNVSIRCVVGESVWERKNKEKGKTIKKKNFFSQSITKLLVDVHQQKQQHTIIELIYLDLENLCGM